VAIAVSLCSSEDHGHHLQKEKAIIAKKFSLCPMPNSVHGVSKSTACPSPRRTFPHLT
jgi:hypothetical protein